MATQYKITQAAFQGTNGHTYATGPFHDIDQIPHGVTIAHEGFLTDVGDFITREQATKDLELEHPVQSEELSLGKGELLEEEADNHEFLVFFKAWLATRNANPSIIKSEDLAGLLAQHNLVDKLPDTVHEVAYRMAGFSPEDSPEFAAARFLSSGKKVPSEMLRAALVAYDEDMEVAALYAFGIPRNEANLQALRSVIESQALDKSEIIVSAIPRLVTAFNAADESKAQAIRRAFGVQAVHKVNFKGKHAKGMAIAVDPRDDQKYLLKPGSGPMSPSLGVKEVAASQSRREVAFAKIGILCGIDDVVVDADLLYLDGEEVACLKLVPSDHKGIDWRKRHDPSFSMPKLFDPHRENGTLFRWAAIDFILGNPDRHAGNILVSDDGDIKLIDHGSSFAGPSFDPANDSKSFIPAYLRAWYADNFIKLKPEERLRHLPSCPKSAEDSWNEWLDAIMPEDIIKILNEYDIHDPAVMERFNTLRSIPPEDRIEALLEFWAGEDGK